MGKESDSSSFCTRARTDPILRKDHRIRARLGRWGGTVWCLLDPLRGDWIGNRDQIPQPALVGVPIGDIRLQTHAVVNLEAPDDTLFDLLARTWRPLHSLPILSPGLIEVRNEPAGRNDPRSWLDVPSRPHSPPACLTSGPSLITLRLVTPRGNARFRLQPRAQRPGGPKAISHQFEF